MGEWLTTVKYYAEHLNEIATFVSTLDPEDTAAIKDVQKLLNKKKPKITMDVVEIQQYYTGIADTITKLETRGLSLAETVELWEDAILHLSATSHQVIAPKQNLFQIKIQTLL